MRHTWVVFVLVLVVLAGCNAGPGDRTPEPIEASASQATVGGGTLSAAGFSEVGVEETDVRRSGTISISGDVEMDLGYQVQATAWRAEYGSGDGVSVFALYTVPMTQPERVDVRIDPLGDRSLADVVANAQSVYADPGEFEHVENRTVTALDSETTVQEYTATATREGSQTDVTVYVTRIDHESDRIRAVAVVPRDADSWETVRQLVENIEH